MNHELLDNLKAVGIAAVIMVFLGLSIMGQYKYHTIYTQYGPLYQQPPLI